MGVCSLRTRLQRVLFFFLVLAFPCAGQAQLRMYRTPDLQLLYYSRDHAYLTRYVAQCFENSLRFHERLFHFTPSEPVTVLLNDFGDYGHGGTSTIPWNSLNIGIEPFDYVYETQPANERFNWLMHHELVHVVATDQATGVDNLYRTLFLGKVAVTPEQPLTMAYSYLTSPRWYSPRWYHEGIAVFLETWMSGGIGRVLGGYDEMVFRTMVRDSSYFYDYVGLESEGTTIDFQVGANAYLYGTRFVSYLAYRYGPGKLLQWFSRTPGSDRWYASQFQDVYGLPLGEEWSSWISWEHAFQRANLDSLRRYPLTQYRRVVDRPLGSVSRAFYDSAEHKVYLALNLPGQLAQVASIDTRTGAIHRLCDVPTPALYYVCSTAYDPYSGDIFFTTKNSTGWRDVNAVNVHTGRQRLLMHNARIGDLVFNRADSTLWGVQHHNGYSTIVQIPPPYTGWRTILQLDYGKDVFDLDISPDGAFLTSSFIEISGRQLLIRMKISDLLAGSPSFETLHEFKNYSPENFVFARDGRSLYGTTYFTGVSNVVRYQFDDSTMHWVTNAETGFFRPLPMPGDSLLVFRYTGKGFLPVMIRDTSREDLAAIQFLGQAVVDRYPVLESWNVGPPSAVRIDSLTLYHGEYDPWSHLRVASGYPDIEGYKDYTSFGYRLNLQEPLGLDAVTLNGSFTPQPHIPADERWHAGLDVRVWQWEFDAAYNRTDFYDLFGPTKTSRKGYAGGITLHDVLTSDRPRTLDYTLSLHGYAGLERLPSAQNIATSYDKFALFDGQLHYASLLKSLGAVDFEEGVEGSIENTTTLVRGRVFPQLFGGAGYGFLLPWDHASLWLRSWLGFAPGERAEPFANFYFGGFGNNWVDHREVRRYREYYSFPGVELNAINGTNFIKLVTEWTLPPLRFRRLGIPDFYCTWARLAVFSGGILTNADREDIQRRAVDAGVQLDFHLVLFSHLDSMLSVGTAVAVERLQRRSHEVMVSLKIL